MQQKIETKQAPIQRSKNIESYVVPREEKVAYRLSEARAELDKLLKGLKPSDQRQFMLNARKDLFLMEDYFYHLSKLKSDEQIANQKQPELFSPTGGERGELQALNDGTGSNNVDQGNS